MNANTAAIIRVHPRCHSRSSAIPGSRELSTRFTAFRKRLSVGARDPYQEPLAACDAPVAPLPSTSGADDATSRLFTLELRQG
jgi:hypothetical protein